MIHDNVLGFHPTIIYALKMNKQKFVFIFARSREEAITFYEKTFHEGPLNCHEYPLEFEIVKGKGVIPFREMKRGFAGFPAVGGVYGC